MTQSCVGFPDPFAISAFQIGMLASMAKGVFDVDEVKQSVAQLRLFGVGLIHSDLQIVIDPLQSRVGGALPVECVFG